MNSKLIIFDLDGTLVDSLSSSYDTDSQIIIELGGSIPDFETYRRHLGERDWEEFYRAFGVKYPDRAVSLYYSKISQKKLTKIPGTENLLQKIRDNNIQTAIVSINESKEHIISKLQSAGLERFFDIDSIHCVDGVKTEAIRKECDRRRILPYDAALYIGDMARDVRDAKAAGVTTIAISNGFSYNPHSLIMQANPDYLFSDISDIASLLEH